MKLQQLNLIRCNLKISLTLLIAFNDLVTWLMKMILIVIKIIKIMMMMMIRGQSFLVNGKKLK